MSDITYHNMCEQLVETIPELSEAYAEELSEWAPEEPGPHNLYSTIFVPWIAGLARKGGNDEVLRRAFDFLESLADSSDEDALNVLAITVVEELVGLHSDVIPVARRFMGPKIRGWFDDYADQRRAGSARAKWME